MNKAFDLIISKFKKIPFAIWIILFFSIIKLIIHFLTNGQYNYNRDECYYIACGEHLDWGYVDHPPLIALLANISRFIFGDSLFGLRFLPAIAGAMLVFFTGLIAKKLGGSIYSVILACISIIAAPMFLSIDTQFAPNVFDELFWVICIYLLILIIKEEKPRYWILFGLFAGIGLMTKHSVILFGLAFIFGLLLTKNRKYFASKWFWFGSLIALVIFIPHILWQIKYNFPTLEFMKNVSLYKNYKASPLEFILSQIAGFNIFASPIWILGLCYFLFNKDGSKFRILSIMYLTLLTLFIIQHGKDYYLAGFYPVLFAGGAVFIEKITLKKIIWLRYIIIILIILGGVIAAPIVLPILPVEKMISYMNSLHYNPPQSENTEQSVLPQVYADMFGWEEMVQKVAKVYNELSPEEKSKCAIIAKNYGEAAAIDFYSKKYGIPKAISGHNSYYLWGPGNNKGDIVIWVYPDTDEKDLKNYFDEVIKKDLIYNKYAMPFDNNYHLYLLKGIKFDLKANWKLLKLYI